MCKTSSPCPAFLALGGRGRQRRGGSGQGSQTRHAPQRPPRHPGPLSCRWVASSCSGSVRLTRHAGKPRARPRREVRPRRGTTTSGKACPASVGKCEVWVVCVSATSMPFLTFPKLRKQAAHQIREVMCPVANRVYVWKGKMILIY